MRLDDTRLARAETVFRDVVDLPAAQRSAALLQRCGDDSELRELVEQILAQDAGSSCEDAGFRVQVPLPPADIGLRRIARFELVREIGRGAVGVVYEARQDHPSRSVAVKLLRFDSARHDVLRRFQLEGEVLGQLNHPGVAHVYEAGVEETQTQLGPRSIPYVAMELIDGQPLGVYADQKRGSTAERLEILARICDAVHHAHQKGVIHRDLKPANILVTAQGQPKVLDFGVARVASERLIDPQDHTQTGQLVGTPAYMSPEQAAGRLDALDVRSDIYSLGVIGFELLAGRLPFDFRGRSLAEIVRIIERDEPIRLGAASAGLRGDIEIVIGKALEKSRERRYDSAAEMAADLRRCMRHEPIIARPATAWYQLRKFARRHWPLVSAAAVLFALMAAAAGWIIAERLEAERAKNQAAALNSFLRDVIAAADPASGRADVQLVEVLRAAADEAATRFAETPELELEVRTLLWLAFKNMALWDEAIIHAERAYALRVQLRGERDPLTWRLSGNLGELYRCAHKYDAAERFTRRVLEYAPPEQPHSPEVLEARRTLAMVASFRGALTEAEEELRDVLAAARTHLGEDHLTTLTTTSSLALLLQFRVRQGVSSDPLREARESAELFRATILPLARLTGEASYTSLYALSNLANSLGMAGSLEEAAYYGERVLELGLARLGGGHTAIVNAREALACVRHAQRRYAEAAAYAIENIQAARRSAGGRDTMQTLAAMSDSLHMMDAGDRLAEGEEYSRLLLGAFGTSSHGGSAGIRYSIYLARFLSRQGRMEEADALFGEILAANIEDARIRDFIDLAFGAHLLLRGQLDEAESRLRGAKIAIGDKDFLTVAAGQELARLQAARERMEAARQGGDE